MNYYSRKPSRHAQIFGVVLRGLFGCGRAALRSLVVIFSLLLLPATASGEPAQSLYVLAIGNNAPPALETGTGLVQLRYADDDAAAFCALTAALTEQIMLLSVPDDETQRRFPEITRSSRPPSLAELRLAISHLSDQLARDRAQGREAALMLFYSGHGFVRPERGAALALLDGEITSAMLFDEILGKLPASFVHLFVDACHAEAVVRPRGEGEEGVSARIVAITADDDQAWLSARTLERFPNVGVVMAAATDQQAHEWDAFRQGVFTHEVLSGLRGGADVNSDGRVEYSELAAFLAAANYDVKDPRGKLNVLVHAPTLNRRVAVVDWSARRNAGWLSGMAALLDHFFVEDDLGNRLLDLHTEEDFPVTLALPPGRTLFVRGPRGETSFRLAPGEKKAFSDLRLSPPTALVRGSVAAAFRDGLFGVPFGPAYYRGFTDRTGAIPVSIPEIRDIPKTRAASRGTKFYATASWIGAGAFLAAAALSGGLALDARHDWEATSIRREAAGAEERYDRWRALFFVSAGSAAALAVLGALLYPWGNPATSVKVAPTLSADGIGLTIRVPW